MPRLRLRRAARAGGSGCAMNEAPRHIHECSTPDCPHYYVCRDRDCRDGWTCPTCEDDEHFNDISHMEQQEQERASCRHS